MKLRRHRPLLLIDIAVPRDIDPAVNQMDNVYLYNVDDLQALRTIISGNARKRSRSARRSSAIRQNRCWNNARLLGFSATGSSQHPYHHLIFMATERPITIATRGSALALAQTHDSGAVPRRFFRN